MGLYNTMNFISLFNSLYFLKLHLAFLLFGAA